jgi:TonB family protein
MNNNTNVKGNKSTVRRTALFALTLMLMWVMPALPAALVRVPNPVLMAAATQTPTPAYPEFAKSSGVQGQVEVDVVVSSDGTVKEARLISGPMPLRDSARDAALKWKFDPAKLHSEQQDVIGTLVFNFKK